MNLPKKVLNGFTAAEVRRITGLSIHMVDYLAREGYLKPTYERERVRGLIRYYSYRDLIVARVVEKLRSTGLELKRLKDSIRLLSEDETWFPKDAKSFDLLVTDGSQIYYHDRSDSLVELTAGKQQRAFAFVLDVMQTKEEVKRRIASAKRRHFTMENRPLALAEKTNSR